LAAAVLEHCSTNLKVYYSGIVIPVDEHHSEHLLTFQLGYLGAGEITVHVVLNGGIDGRRGEVSRPSCSSAPTAPRTATLPVFRVCG
jgi:hypothetical protein